LPMSGEGAGANASARLHPIVALPANMSASNLLPLCDFGEGVEDSIPRVGLLPSAISEPAGYPRSGWTAK